MKFKTIGHLTAYYEGRYLYKIINKKGTLAPVAIVQMGHLPGFTARYDNPPYRIISSGHRNAESLAERLAKKGHKTVTIRT